MKIILKNHDFTYEMQTLARFFFPKEKIVFIEDIKAVENDEMVVSSVLDKKTEEINVTTHIMPYNIQGYAKQKVSPKEKEAPLLYQKICKETAKMSFYKAATKITQMHLPWGILTGIRPVKKVNGFLEEGYTDEQIIKTIKHRYVAQEDKIRLALDVAKRQQKILKKLSSKHIGIYVGIPFCPSRCAYCSFISTAFKSAKTMIEPYIELLIDEIRYTRQIIKQLGWTPSSIYIGGGTPTTLTPSQLDRLLKVVYEAFYTHNDIEFTVEAGRPDTIHKHKLAVMKTYAVNRISINPQTMNGQTLKKIGRDHSPEDIIKAFDLARKEGFNHINADIIAGLPDETYEMYAYTLREIQKLNPESITAHTMSIKRSAKLHDQKEMFLTRQAEEVRKMVDYTQQFMNEHVLYAYYMYRQKNMLGNFENVGYCKVGFEGIYNIQIMEEQHSIISMGCGGVTKIFNPHNNQLSRIFNVKEVKDYINRIEEMKQRKNMIYQYIKGSD